MKYETVGSFLPPEALVQAREAYNLGDIDEARLAEIEDIAVGQLVESQIEAGLEEVTSGELRRIQWDKDFWFGLGGIKRERVESGRIYQPLDSFTDEMCFTGRIAYNPEHPFFDDFAFLYNAVGGRAVCRQTLPSPANLYLEVLIKTDGFPERVYPDADNLLTDIAEAYKATVMCLYELGCRSVQFDDTVCGLMCDGNYTKRLLQGGVDLISLHSRIIDLLNGSVDGLPSDMELSVYLSGGDNIVPEWESRQYPDNIMPKVLSEVNVDKFYMPFDMGKDSQLEILRHIPSGKRVVLGLTDAHSPLAENVADIRAAIAKAGGYMPLAMLSVSPKTGFKLSSYASRGLTYGDQWQKILQLREALAY